MELKFKCECGKRLLKNVENPTVKQISEEMVKGFISITCEEHSGE